MLSYGVGFVDEGELAHVPGDVPGIGRDLHVLHLRDQAARTFLEVARVVEGQARARAGRRTAHGYGRWASCPWGGNAVGSGSGAWERSSAYFLKGFF